MLSREERILSELLRSRGLLADEALARCAAVQASSSPGRSLAEILIEAGHLEPGEAARLAEEARALDNALTPEPPLGRRLDEFRLLREIGRGGMGIVYEAEQEPLGRLVALKLLPAGAAFDERLAIRFLRESRAAARLDHPGIVRVLTSGRAEGVLYFTMELVTGRSLAAILGDGVFDPERAAQITAEICSALAHAHDAGLVHRDVKPENILIGEDGRPRITDFGLVHELHGLPITMSHLALGTPAYVAPEQARGEAVDPRSDVYGLGAVLYAMLAGRPPYTGDVPALVISRMLGEDPAPLASLRPDVPPGLAAICHRALARHPDDRYPTARAFGRDLERFLAGDRPEALGGERRAWTRIAVGMAALGVAAAIWAWLAPGAERPSRIVPTQSVRAVFSPLPGPAGTKRWPSLSPDGEWIAYAADVDGDMDIYLQRVDATHADNLTAESPADDYQPAFSPDGRQLAFKSARADTTGMVLLDLAERSVRWLDVAGYEPTWSPDGTRIALVSAGSDRPFLPGRQVQLLAFDLGTGERSLLTSNGGSTPQWSPRGQRIAFASRSGGRSDIWTLPAVGGKPARVTDDPAEDWSPAWSPDGAQLVFGSDRGGTMSLWRVAVDATSGAPEGPPERISTPPFASPFSLTAASRGPRLALVSWRANESLHTFGFDPDRGALLDDVAWIAREAVLARYPDPAPNGREIVFSAAVPGTGETNLVIESREGAAPRRLTDDPFRDEGPRWSPDGRRIAFHSDRGGRMEIWTIRPDGTGLERLAQISGGDVLFPVWSPDGARVAFTRAGGGAFVVRVDRAGESPVELPPFDEEAASFAPSSWSPDGSTLAGDARGIVLFRLDDGRYHRVTGVGEKPTWLPDGRRLLFADAGGISLVDARTGTTSRLFPSGPSAVVPSFGLTRDGRRLYVSLAADDRTISLVTLVEPDRPAASAQGVK